VVLVIDSIQHVQSSHILLLILLVIVVVITLFLLPVTSSL